MLKPSGWRKRERGGWCVVVDTDNVYGHITFRCKCCGNVLTTKLTSKRACERAHWPGRSKGAACKGTLQSAAGPSNVAEGSQWSETRTFPTSDAGLSEPTDYEPEHESVVDPEPGEGNLYLQSHVGALRLPPSYDGQRIAKRFPNLRRWYYGTVVSRTDAFVLEGTVLTEQWLVIYEDGQREDFNRDQLEEGIANFTAHPPLDREGNTRDISLPLASDSDEAGRSGDGSEFSGQDDDDDDDNAWLESASLYSEDSTTSSDRPEDFDDFFEDFLEDELVKLCQPLYPGARENVGTYIVNKLMLKRAGTGISNKGASLLLRHEKSVQPEGNLCPGSYKEALAYIQVIPTSCLHCPHCMVQDGNSV
jgi:hypothetical protein